MIMSEKGHNKYIYTMYIYRKGSKKLADFGRIIG